jgi:hypothetical protein
MQATTPYLPRGQGREFSLDILFHRMSEIAIYRQTMGTQWSSGPPTASISLQISYHA